MSFLKIILIFFAILAFIVVVVIIGKKISQKSQSPSGPNGPADSCNPQNVYRLSSPGDLHMLSLDPNEASDQGYTSDGVLFNSCSSQAPGTVPLYRLFNSSTADHMASLNSAESSSYVPDQNILGYVWPTIASNPTSSANMIPIFRLVNGSVQHMTSTSATEGSPFYRPDFNGQPIFYALSPQ